MTYYFLECTIKIPDKKIKAFKEKFGYAPGKRELKYYAQCAKSKYPMLDLNAGIIKVLTEELNEK